MVEHKPGLTSMQPIQMRIPGIIWVRYCAIRGGLSARRRYVALAVIGAWAAAFLHAYIHCEWGSDYHEDRLLFWGVVGFFIVPPLAVYAFLTARMLEGK